ncbi:MAG: UDP-N-acetylglucosamine 1-carboxyvinyltransferase [Gaiellales bacterium]
MSATLSTRGALGDLLVIEGGHPLAGRVAVTGNKNGALPIIAACLLTEQECVIENVPRIRDVEVMAELVAATGAEVEWLARNTLRVRAAGDLSAAIDRALSVRIRASILLAGPLLARCGQVVVPPPGGDVIGRRRIDTHLHAFAALGAEVAFDRDFTLAAPGGLVGARFFMDEPSVTATENAVMAAVLAKGETTLINAACEPHVQDLCRFLVAMGAEIDGIGSNVLTIRGRAVLGGATHRIGPDHIEVASFIGLAAVTPGEIVIEDVEPEDLRPVLHGFERLGVRIELEGRELRVPDHQELVIRDDVGGQVPKLEDGPWPQFPADVTSIAVAVATQARGTILIFEKMFENRLVFTDKLVSMGARIVLCDPHRAIVTGPSRLVGERVESPDIRAGMAMLIASLCAEGTTTIGNVGQIDRGYERIDERLRALGARIERITG